MDKRSLEFDPTTNSNQYLRSGRMWQNLARVSFGIQISDSTVHNWVNGFGVIKYLDDVYDNPELNPDQQAEIHEQVEMVLLEPHKDAVETPDLNLEGALGFYTRELASALTRQQAENFIRIGREVVGLTKKISASETRKEFISSTVAEGERCADMLFTISDEADTKHEKFALFMDSVRYASGMGNVVDSFIDLKADFEQGISKVKPSLKNRLSLAKASLPLIFGTLKKFKLGSIYFATPFVHLVKDKA